MSEEENIKQWTAQYQQGGEVIVSKELEMAVALLAVRKERIQSLETELKKAVEVLNEVTKGYEADPGSDFDWDRWYSKSLNSLESARSLLNEKN